MKKRSKRVCPVENAGHLDSILRKLVHNPKRILGKDINEGMTVLDVGCGPGLFAIEMAKMVGKSGRVIAADLQEGMLEKVRSKIKGKEAEKIIRLHKCKKDKIDIPEKVDLVLAFYMAHEVPSQEKFLKEIRSILKPEGKMYLIEPKFHVSKKAFEETIEKAAAEGLKIVRRPKVFLSRAVVLKR
ncbi:MAG: class I SAM-dependent methyltransferase [archaeon]|nr:class I SAM-dependent methyltransferase [archaeon]